MAPTQLLSVGYAMTMAFTHLAVSVSSSPALNVNYVSNCSYNYHHNNKMFKRYIYVAMVTISA